MFFIGFPQTTSNSSDIYLIDLISLNRSMQVSESEVIFGREVSRVTKNIIELKKNYTPNRSKIDLTNNFMNECTKSRFEISVMSCGRDKTAPLSHSYRSYQELQWDQ